jgi:hypothetical protein
MISNILGGSVRLIMRGGMVQYQKYQKHVKCYLSIYLSELFASHFFSQKVGRERDKNWPEKATQESGNPGTGLI